MCTAQYLSTSTSPAPRTNLLKKYSLSVHMHKGDKVKLIFVAKKRRQIMHMVDVAALQDAVCTVANTTNIVDSSHNGVRYNVVAQQNDGHVTEYELLEKFIAFALLDIGEKIMFNLNMLEARSQDSGVLVEPDMRLAKFLIGRESIGIVHNRKLDTDDKAVSEYEVEILGTGMQLIGRLWVLRKEIFFCGEA